MDKSYTLNLTREELISLSFFIDQSFIESLKTNENKSLKTMEYIVDIANIYNTLLRASSNFVLFAMVLPKKLPQSLWSVWGRNFGASINY